MVTLRPGKWEARFLPVERPYTTESSMIALEEAMKVSPADAFWFHERWKPHLRRSFPLSRWFGDPTARGKTPHRALIWLADVPQPWQPPEEWLHPDVIYEVAQNADAPRPSWLSDSTRIHRISENAGREEVQNRLAEIDALDELPLDFILTPESRSELTEAAHQEVIPVVALR